MKSIIGILIYKIKNRFSQIIEKNYKNSGVNLKMTVQVLYLFISIKIRKYLICSKKEEAS